MLNEEKRFQISKDVLIDMNAFSTNVTEAFQQGRITEAEYYSAIGLYRIELALDVVTARLKLEYEKS